MTTVRPVPRIIVVEDEAIIACDLRERLQGLGYQVPAMAASGEDAVAAARKHRPDLVLMDIGLRGMDGITAGDIINRELHIPIFFMSAYSKTSMEAGLAKIPDHGYLGKPMGDYELKTAVGLALAGTG